MNYMEESEGSNIAHGLCSLVVSQYEGIGLKAIKKLYSDFSMHLAGREKSIYRNYIAEFFDVSISALTSNQIEE
jgi:hypothetical protein